MTPKKFYFVMIGVNALLLLLLVGGVVFGSMLITKQAEKLTKAKVQSKVIEEQQIQLTRAKQDIEKYTELNEVTKSIVPQDKDQAKTVREITKLAEESGIVLKGIAFNSSSLGQTAPPRASSGGAEGGATGQSAPQQSTTLTQVKPVEGISGVFALEVIVTSLESQPVPYANFIEFLEKLESNRRTAHVDNINVKPSGGGSNVGFVLTLNAYVKP